MSRSKQETLSPVENRDQPRRLIRYMSEFLKTYSRDAYRNSLFNPKDDYQTFLNLFSFYSKITPIQKYEVLESTSTDIHAPGLLNYLANRVPDYRALALLRSLDCLEPQLLENLFKGDSSTYEQTRQNIFHVALCHYSSEVFDAVIKLVSKLNAATVRHFLLDEVATGNNIMAHRHRKLASGKRAPLALFRSEKIMLYYAFSRTDSPEIALSLTKMLAANPELKPLLTDAGNRRSPLELAVESNNTLVLNWFFEQEDYQTQLSEEKRQALIELAKTKKNNEALSIIQAAPVYHALTHTPNSDLTEFEDLLTNCPEIMQSRWSKGKTLLHLAAEKGNLRALKGLLKKGAAINALDSQGLTPLHYSMQFKHNAITKALFKNKGLNIYQKNTDGEWIIEHVLKNQDYPILAKILKKIGNDLPGKEAVSSLVTALTTLAPSSSEPAAQWLDTVMKNLSIPGQIFQHCKQTQDARMLFLNQFAVMSTSTSDEFLNSICKKYVKYQINHLRVESNSEKRKRIKQDLIVFLFSMPTEAISAFIQSLELNEKEQHELEILLCNTLAKPAIYSKLSLTQHKAMLSIFTEHSQIFSTLIDLYLNFADLNLMPIQNLVHLYELISPEMAYHYSEARMHPLLSVLSLQKLLAESPRDLVKLERLYAQLEHELSLLISKGTPESLGLLHITLDLITSSEVKTFVKRFIQNQDNSPLATQRIQTLFEYYRHDSALDCDSLLYDLLLDCCKKGEMPQGKKFYSALSEFVRVARADDVLAILDHQRQSLTQHYAVSSFLSSAMTGVKQQPANYRLSNWLFNLCHAESHLAVSPVVNAIHVLSSECSDLSKRLPEEHAALKEGFATLKQQLLIVAAAVLGNQYSKQALEVTPEIEQAISALMQTHSQILTDPEQPGSEQSTFPEEVQAFFEQNSIGHLMSLLRQTLNEYRTKHEQRQNWIKHSLDGNNDKDLLAQAFRFEQGEFEPSEMYRKSARFMSNVEQHTHQLAKSLRQGIMQSSQVDALLPACLAWQRDNGVYAERNQATLLPNIHFHTNSFDTIAAQCDDDYPFIKQAAVVLKKIKSMRHKCSSINALIQCLYTLSEEELECIFALAQKTQVHDLCSLISYLLVGKANELEYFSLKDIPLDSRIKHVQHWFSVRLNFMSDVVSSLFAMKVLTTGLYLDEKENISRLQALNALIGDNDSYLSLSNEAAQVLFKSYTSEITDSPNSPLSQQFIITLRTLLLSSNPLQQANYINQLPLDLLETVLKLCLSGLSSNKPDYLMSCKTLLMTISQYATNGEESRVATIKACLSQQDLDLLSSSDLKNLAQSVLAEQTASLDELTIDGAWIQRLLTSPKFIAQCSPADLTQLVDRYKAISLSLKQDEFDSLNRFVSTKMLYSKQHQKGMQQVQEEIIASPARRIKLLEKRDRLLQFRSNDSIRALFNQLEDNCIALKQTDEGLAQAALRMLAHYHHQNLAETRTDSLFKISDSIYSRIVGDQGDLSKASSTLFTWLERHLPHCNFHQSELERKSDSDIYNRSGQPIGFLDELNNAWVLVNDEPMLLVEAGVKPKTPIYDKRRRKIGVLSETGKLHRENLFQKNTSALLVSTVPVEQLDSNPTALTLLLQDVFNENSVTALYENSQGEARQQWLRAHVSRHLNHPKNPVSKEAINALIEQSSYDSILNMMADFDNSSNALNVLFGVLDKQEYREKLFAESEPQLFFKFLARNHDSKILSEFLLRYHSEPWFSNGLALFANYAKKKGKSDLLLYAIDNMSQQGLKGLSKKATRIKLDLILKSLVATNQTLKVILNDFFNSTELSVQTIHNSDLSLFLNYFDKYHITDALKKLNSQPNWRGNAQYRFLLMLFNDSHKRLFPGVEHRFSERGAWQPSELDELTQFVMKHLKAKNEYDKDKRIGQKLLSELVFRCANFGKTDLFYTKDGRINDTIVNGQLKRSMLESLCATGVISDVANAASNAYSQVSSWFGGNKKTAKHALSSPNSDATIDWGELHDSSWKYSNTTKLPIMIAYLINYSGKIQPLSDLLEHSFMSLEFRKNTVCLNAISELMVRLQRRDVSRVIFAAFERIGAKIPGLINETVLLNMAKYYALNSAQGIEPQHESRNIMSLIKHFGQQKHYTLTRYCCNLLIKKSDSHQLRRTLNSAATEARVESKLESIRNRWYFGIYRFFKRLFSYGSTNTGIVKLCDEDTPYKSPICTPKFVRTHVANGQMLANKLECFKKLKKLQAQVNALGAEETTPSLSKASAVISSITHSGFFNGKKMASNTRQKECLSQANTILKLASM